MRCVLNSILHCIAQFCDVHYHVKSYRSHGFNCKFDVAVSTGVNDTASLEYALETAMLALQVNATAPPDFHWLRSLVAPVNKL